VWLRWKQVLPESKWGGRLAIALIATPFLANTAGWIFTEMGRQPWVVAPNPTGIPEVRLLTENGVSTSVGGTSVLLTMVTFTLVYGALGVVELVLLKRYVQAGPDAAITGILGGSDEPDDDTSRGPDHRPEGSDDEPIPSDDDADRLVFAY
jgi:cytochrome d ubiquinol oxidase subunit I